MSTLPDNELDLEKLFLPAWAQEPSSAKYANYEGGEDRFDRRGGRDHRGPRPPGRGGPPGNRRDAGGPRGERRGPPRGEGGPRPQGERPGGGRPGFRRPDQRDPREPREYREAAPPLPEIDVNLIPDEKGVESLSRQIKVTGRAYPLFDIAQLILQKPERHLVEFSIKKNAEGKPVQPLFVCLLDDTLWLSEDEVVSHVLKQHFATFYQAERTATEPPKGKYTFVAQCGLSGLILGPPNHHDYQNQLRKLHTERFSRMPFEAFKAKVRIVRDEAVVKQWVDEQSWKTEYLCLNLPEPVKLPNMEAVEKHFRETHKENIIKPVESHRLNGAAARALRSTGLSRLVRSVWEDQRRFPLSIATVLSQQFATHGLQFFKVNKTITHVSVARPHYLDLAATPVSDGVKKIVQYIDANPRCNRRRLVEALAPSPAPPAPAVPETPPAEGQEPAKPAPAAESAQPTPEQNAVIGDLHWLIHEGHVIEFANGCLETAKKPVPRPPKPQPKPADQTTESPAQPEAPVAGKPAAPGSGPQTSPPSPGEAAGSAPAPSTAEAPAAIEPEPAMPASAPEPSKPVEEVPPAAPEPAQAATRLDEAAPPPAAELPV